MIPKGKSHGLVLLLDCSGSMQENMPGSIEQILVLTMFCRKVNIPFRVFGFTDCSETYNIDRGLDEWEKRKLETFSFSRNVGELAFSNVQLREYLNSKMSNADFTKSLRNMLLLKESYTMGRSYNRVGRPLSENLSNTPLIQAIISVGSMIETFKTTNNIDLVSLIIVHDGDSDTSSSYNVEVENRNNNGNIEKNIWSYGFDVRSSNIVVRDRKNKFQYLLKNDPKKYYAYHTNEQLVLAILDWIRVVKKTKIFGFFILASRHGQAKNAIRNRYCLEDGRNLSEMKRNNPSNYFDTEKNIFKKYREDKFLISKNEGYNSFYLISGGSDLQTEEEGIEIDGKVTSSKLKSAFMKMAKKKQVNRVLVSKFIQGIAA
jgi:hypothetical protein